MVTRSFVQCANDTLVRFLESFGVLFILDVVMDLVTSELFLCSQLPFLHVSPKFTLFFTLHSINLNCVNKQFFFF